MKRLHCKNIAAVAAAVLILAVLPVHAPVSVQAAPSFEERLEMNRPFRKQQPAQETPTEETDQSNKKRPHFQKARSANTAPQPEPQQQHAQPAPQRRLQPAAKPEFIPAQQRGEQRQQPTFRSQTHDRQPESIRQRFSDRNEERNRLERQQREPQQQQAQPESQRRLQPAVKPEFIPAPQRGEQRQQPTIRSQTHDRQPESNRQRTVDTDQNRDRYQKDTKHRDQDWSRNRHWRDDRNPNRNWYRTREHDRDWAIAHCRGIWGGHGASFERCLDGDRWYRYPRIRHDRNTVIYFEVVAQPEVRYIEPPRPASLRSDWFPIWYLPQLATDTVITAQDPYQQNKSFHLAGILPSIDPDFTASCVARNLTEPTIRINEIAPFGRLHDADAEAVVFVNDTVLNMQILAEGCAEFDYTGCEEMGLDFCDLFQDAENYAKRNRIGIWE